jgi:hypothetical protein
MKFLIYVRGNTLVNGHVRMKFRWVPKYALYLWEGKETEAKDLDAVCEEVFIKDPRYRLMFPSLKIAPGTAKEVAEITVAQAEEVMQSLAPHRLKGKPGPKVEPVAA